MEKRNPILEFREKTSESSVNLPTLYSLQVGVHETIKYNGDIMSHDKYFTNSMVTRSREAVDATEYSE